MTKFRIAALTSSMGALALLLAPSAAADFDRAGYLRCMVADSMSVGGLGIDSSTAAKLGAQAYDALGGASASKAAQDDEITALTKQHGVSQPLATLIVRCAGNPRG
ncbi:hypothetical protein H7K45_25300 [Mycobacterium yunnanensis]|uniref:DUF732 domain-containing protein n=1 Tax=Mycobacterium yunnanensis TaxID=368477 RepID=A0A9X3BW13_9MYCO|nr:hypothetical protein [Mycobacterium yunnanensis]MCV7423875.1 hypothetical protein [Mycobacterium yunnanensis]